MSVTYIVTDGGVKRIKGEDDPKRPGEDVLLRAVA